MGKLSFKDFEMVVKKEPLLLEAFGPCLPDAKVTKLASSMQSLHKTCSKTSKHACTVGPYLITRYTFNHASSSILFSS